MSQKEFIKENFIKYPNLSYLDRIESIEDDDLSSDGNIFETKIKEEKINDKFIYEYDLNKSEEKIEKVYRKNTYNKQYQIMNFHFDILKKEDKEDLFSLNSSRIIKDKSKLKKESQKRGRKAKRNNSTIADKNGKNKVKDVHDRYSDDNIRKKCKNMILKYALEFLNQKIKEIYKGDIGKGKFKKKLKILNQEKKVKLSLNNEKLFLEKTLGEIFSENISARFSNYPSNHNKLLIESLLKEKDDEKRKYFIKLFNLTFLECLNYFRGGESYKSELDGFKKFSSIKETLIVKDGKEYVDLLIYYLNNYKKILENKKPRNTKGIKAKISNK